MDSSEQLIARLKALADPVRLRVVALCRQGECSVSELTRVLALSQPRVSQHLRQLCDAGLLQRYRDGHFVFYRVPVNGGDAGSRRLLGLIPGDEPTFERDMARLRKLRGTSEEIADIGGHDKDARRLQRALVALTLSEPLGDLLDIGCGQGRFLKLLASRARRIVGVDIDADARHFARTELLLAGVANASLRKGDMYALPFADQEFDTVIFDDVLGGADEPLLAIVEARRLLRSGGRMWFLAQTNGQYGDIRVRIAAWCEAAGLHLAPPRPVPHDDPRWILAVATVPGATAAVA